MISRIATRIAQLDVVSGIRSKDSKHPFDLDVFKSLKDLKSIQEYAASRLRKLGEGESRVVYTLSSRDVLKVAKSSKGIDQNSLEVSTYWDSIRFMGQMTHINDSHPDGFWVISELTRPLTTSDVEEGGDYHDRFVAIWATIQQINKPYWMGSDFYSGPNSPDLYTGEKARLRDFVRHMISKGHPSGEIGKRDSWGRTTNGRMVALDFGADQEYFSKYK